MSKNLQDLQLQQKIMSSEILNQNVRNEGLLTPKHEYSVLDKSFSQGTTFDSGKLIPILIQECSPGDIYQIDTQALIRMSAPSSTPFTNLEYDINYFYVPYHILDNEFKNIMGEDLSYNNNINELPRFPLLTCSNESENSLMYSASDLASYFNFPQNIPLSTIIKTLKSKDITNGINIYPFLAYAKVWNDWYRHQYYASEIDCESVINSETRTLDLDSFQSSMLFQESIKYGKKLAPTYKLNDYFVGVLPYRQIGPTLKIGDINLSSLKVDIPPLKINNDTSSNADWFQPKTSWVNNMNGDAYVGLQHGKQYLQFLDIDGQNQQGEISPLELAFTTSGQRLSNAITSDSEFNYDINTFRLALSNQHRNELLARCGTRYVEQLKSIWGIEVKDISVDRSEYLGGQSDTLIFNNSVANTNAQIGNTNQLLGNTISSSLFNHIKLGDTIECAAQYHGLLLGFITIRSSINYGSQGLPRIFIKNESLDLYDPYFDNISEQPIYDFELNLETAINSGDDFGSLLGYNEPWLDYKMNINNANGYLSLNNLSSLFSNFYFGEKINARRMNTRAFVQWNPNIVGNMLFNVTDNTKQFYHQFIAHFQFDIKYTTQMSRFEKVGVQYV